MGQSRCLPAYAQQVASAVASSHCSFCGHRFASRVGWPRTCAACGNISYRNPLPVAVLVLPVEGDGVLLVRRVSPPAGLALPSGYIEYGERWQDAAARELAEETGVHVDPAAVRELRVRSGSEGTLLIFATAPAVSRDALRAFTPSAEVSELVVVDGPREDVVFPLDAEVLAERFAAAPPHPPEPPAGRV
jgi:ADP-ribose pyrophosphatase YjhB (NUDIX family)